LRVADHRRAALRLAGRRAAGCAGLALLEVNPVLASVRPMSADADARIAVGNRRARLN
jgi:hypothetical protein